MSGRRSAWKLLNWAVTIACLILLVRWIPVDETVAAIAGVSPSLLAAAVVATLGNLALRGVRWAVLLGRTRGIDMARAGALSAVGLALNATLPGKVGELARVGLAPGIMSVTIGTAATAAVVERIVDLLALALLGAVALAFVPVGAESGGFGVSHAALDATVLVLLSAGIGAFALVAAAAFDPLGGWMRRCGLGLMRSARLKRRFKRLCLDIRSGTRRLFQWHSGVPVLMSTLILWATLAAGVYITGLAMPGVVLSLLGAAAFAAVTTLASALPSAPGAWGVYEAAGVLIGSVVAQYESTSALAAFALVAHSVQYFPVVLTGFGSWLFLGAGSLRSLKDTDPRRIRPDREFDS